MSTRVKRTELSMRDWARFSRKVDRTGDCHTWRAGRDSDGYGRFCLFGKNIMAHRAAWWFEKGKPPDHLEVLHNCDVPPCVNVAHLRLGTHRQNMDEMVTKRRHRASQQSGDLNPNSHLSWEDVREIRAWNATHKYLGWIYGVHPGVIGQIKNGRTWRE